MARDIAVLVMAAGESKRLGRPKQLEPIEGTSLLRRAVIAASSIGPPIVVLGANHAPATLEVSDLDCSILLNDRWREGIGTSIARGMHQVRDVEAVMLTLCDQPRVTGEVLLRLVETYRSSGADIVAASYSGTLGVPAIYATKHFDELRALKGDKGGKSLIVTHGALAVDCPEAALDIDTEADLIRLE